MATSNIRVYRDLMGENEKWAAKTREFLAARQLTMLNLIGSPGSGKTTLLAALVREAGASGNFSVLEGDVETTHDAERIAALGIPVSQLLTNGACHLEAKLVHYALKDLAVKDRGTVVVENVGNLVCPAEFDIGEHAKVAVLSVTEGEDKPLKYPLLFRECKAVVLTKTDLLPHLRFDLAQCREYIRQVHSSVPVFEVSAVSGAGVRELLHWVQNVNKG
ncbi:MAG: Hydrogenase isoenzymes nickel incorporation protein HypB [Verrucomicrobia bacterium ADurb.Bin345]|nr:MAG: Hydrogenase isoenzymes nickel incorporation protein HypB [Verrucomicrobia bacterium ADurb.Bin345]